MYHCSECGASVTVKDATFVRTCKHDAPVVADMTATAKGAGGLS
jgi:hypothetical protein